MKWKKRWPIACALLALLISLVLPACSNSGNNDQTKTEEPKQETDSIDEANQPEQNDPETKQVKPETENPNFRNAKWGMTKDEVRLCEDAVFIQDIGEAIKYSGTVANFNADIFYGFDDYGKLYRGIYSIRVSHSSDNLYIDDYKKLYDAVTSKYGNPMKSLENWKDSYYKDKPEKYGTAIAMGDLSYTALWETEETKIIISLSGDNFDISLSLFYTSKTYEPTITESNDGI